jgi:hypothetical protein
MIQKAQTLEDIYSIFEYSYLTTKEDREFYVPIYSKNLTRLKTKLVKKKNIDFYKTFYITGQIGNGKSTALQYIQNSNEEIKEKYEIIYIDGVDAFRDVDTKIDFIDILITIGLYITKDLPTLENRFMTELKELKDLKIGKINKEQIISDVDKDSTLGSFFAELKFGLLDLVKAGANFRQKYLYEKEVREVVKKVFQADKKYIIDLINSIILEFNTIHSPKQLLIILDGLEKRDDIDELINRDFASFNDIKAEKIVSIPIYITKDNPLFGADLIKFSIIMDKNPYKDDNGSVVEKNRQLLKDVVLARIENKEIIEEDALNMIVDYSGGNLRQLIKLTQESAIIGLEYEDEIISQEYVEEAIDTLKSQYTGTISGRLSALSEILKHNEVTDNNSEALKKSIKDNMCIAYTNGDMWYNINPILTTSVKRHIKREEEIKKEESKS